MDVRRAGYALGAEITGIDLSEDPSDGLVARIRAALLENIVLCIRGQNIGPEQLLAFAARFGEVDDNERSPHNRHADYPALMLLSNRAVTLNGKPAGGGYRNGDSWHSDFSTKESPTTLTFLVGKELPPVGGDTMFSNMYRAFETLSPAMQAAVESLHGVHDGTLAPGFRRMSEEQREAARRRALPVVHPIVRVHPETGRKALYVDAFVRKFVGMTEEESKPLLDYLLAHAISHEFVYRHRWVPSDLVMWDNRCAIHLAVQDYDQTQLRWLLRCSLVGPKLGTIYQEGDLELETAVRA